MADLVFAFDAALDHPLPVPEAAPPDVAATMSRAAAAALDEAAGIATAEQAAALVLCGRLLDPHRASPAQAAHLRTLVVSLADRGCRTVVVAEDADACHELSRMLGEPRGLSFVTPAAPLSFDVRGLAVEIASAHGHATAAATAVAGGPGPLQRRVVIGWDTAHWTPERRTDLPDFMHPAPPPTPAPVALFAAAAAASPAWSQPGTLLVWGSRDRQPMPPGVRHLSPLQPRSAAEASEGECRLLSLVARDPDELPRAADAYATPHADWRATWQAAPTHRVVWQTVTVESPVGDDEELAATLWAALEKHAAVRQAPLVLARCAVACGTSVARRVRIGEIAAETLTRLRGLAAASNASVWCRELVAEPTESLAPLGHARSGGRPGTTTSFSSALADIVTLVEQSETLPPDQAREAGWLALELIESV